MPTTGLIIEPLTGDTVTQPVVVRVGYTTTSVFDLTCCVHTTDESPTQSHPPPPSPGTHTSSGISPGPGTWTVYANDITAPSTLDDQPGVIVLRAGVKPPIVVEDSRKELMVGGKKKRVVKGTTIANAVYVVCVVYEIDTKAGTRTVVAVGADMVKHARGKHKWSVTVVLKIKKPHNFQYVARVTAYDGTGAALGTQSKLIKK